MRTKSKQIAKLLLKINAAVKSANAAEQTVTTAQAELVSRARVVGELLLEAKRLHPKTVDFEAFLKKANGLKLSRAYDYMKMVGGRKTDDEIRKARDELKAENTERRRKARAKKKLLKDSETVSESGTPGAALAQFRLACKHLLPQLTQDEQRKACNYFAEVMNTLSGLKAA
jgi:hypothetical protein